MVVYKVFPSHCYTEERQIRRIHQCSRNSENTENPVACFTRCFFIKSFVELLWKYCKIRDLMSAPLISLRREYNSSRFITPINHDSYIVTIIHTGRRSMSNESLHFVLSFLWSERSINACRTNEMRHRLYEGRRRIKRGHRSDLGFEGLKRDDEEMGVSFLHCKTNKTR